jgi:hypothetical protein
MKTLDAAAAYGEMHNRVAKVLAGLAANSGQDTRLRSQLASAVSGGYDYADTLHNIYLDYGYPIQLQFSNFWNMYRRFGVAARVVTLYPNQTWLDDPIIESSNAAFVHGVETLHRTRGLWRRLKGLDTRQRVGRYAGLFMRVRDNLAPDQPIAGKLAGLATLVDMVPLYESQLTVLETHDNVLNDDYGQPKMYQFTSGAAGDRNDKTQDSFNIHPSRVVIAAEGSDNGGIYGVPALESIYNSLMDLRKVLGGGGEGFYKNSSQNIVFNVQDPENVSAHNAALLKEFNEQYDDFAQNRQRRAMWTPGMDSKTLESSLMSPEHFANTSLLDISAGAGIPLALLVGKQEGRLAGDQDTKAFLGLVQARREDFATDMVTATLDWCSRWGVLPAAEYDVAFPDALSPSDDEKLANADKMADINQKIFLSGGSVAFTGEEIREQAGFEATADADLPPPDENLDDVDI